MSCCVISFLQLRGRKTLLCFFFFLHFFTAVFSNILRITPLKILIVLRNIPP
ncbi:hypothetical protein Hanom_Chr13g01238771 [Helianthus anomalus]